MYAQKLFNNESGTPAKNRTPRALSASNNTSGAIISLASGD